MPIEQPVYEQWVTCDGCGTRVALHNEMEALDIKDDWVIVMSVSDIRSILQDDEWNVELDPEAPYGLTFWCPDCCPPAHPTT